MTVHLISDDPRETERLEKLKSFDILDTAPAPEFDTVVKLAQRLLDVPIAMVSLVDEHRQWFKASCGLSISEGRREDAFCAHALHVDDIMIVEDATRDPRFAANPLVTGPMNIRFYASVPLRPHAEGFADDLSGIGTLCIIDTKPRTLSLADRQLLRDLAGLASALVSAHADAARARRLSEASRRHAAMLERQHLQLCQAERMAGIGSWRLELADQSVHWSEQVFAVYGLRQGRVPSLADALSFYPADRRAEIAMLLERGATHCEAFEFESDFLRADGQQRRVRGIGEPQLVDGVPVALIGVFQDITERHAREQSLRKRAGTDALTALPNRARFEAELATLMTDIQAGAPPACLLLLDLDGFKAVNDTFGHAVGDQVLRVMADRLNLAVDHGNFAARLGGDEFVVLLRQPADEAAVEALIARLLGTLRYDIERQGLRREVAVTVGAAWLDAADATADTMHQADLALYQAKRDERGTGRIFRSKKVLRASVTDLL